MFSINEMLAQRLNYEKNQFLFSNTAFIFRVNC